MTRVNHNRPLVILTIAHVLFGLVIGFLAEDGPGNFLMVVYLGLFFSQTSLVGIWGGLSTFGWAIRFVGVTIGMAYLVLHMFFSLGQWYLSIVALVILPTVAVTALMVFVRRFFGRLERNSKPWTSENKEGLQFTIRHLMLLTLIVSCMLAIGRWLRPYFLHADELAVILTLSLCFVSVGVTSVWALLGRSHLFVRSCVVLCIGAGAGCVPGLFLRQDGGVHWQWIALMIVQAAVLLGSLFVVRQCGFRLVRIPFKGNRLNDGLQQGPLH